MATTHVSSSLSDHDLVAGLQGLVSKGRKLDAEILRYIGEVDRRRLYREHACSSMFVFCTERLGMSEGAAYKRIRVARAARAIPLALESLQDGSVHLAGLHVLAPHLTDENAAAVLKRATGKSKRQIEVLVRDLAPKPDVTTTIRKASPTRPILEARPRLSPGTADKATPLVIASPAALERTPPTKAARITPLSPARYHVNFTANEGLKRNLDKAKELAGHGVAVESLFEQAMELLVETLEKRRLGRKERSQKTPDGSNPRKPEADGGAGLAQAQGRSKSTTSRYLPKAIRREVFERDGGQCTYADASGRRCSERCGLHFDHIAPHAQGGENTAENLRIRCGPHNQLHADECFGSLFMAQRRGLAPPATG